MVGSLAPEAGVEQHEAAPSLRPDLGVSVVFGGLQGKGSGSFPAAEQQKVAVLPICQEGMGAKGAWNGLWAGWNGVWNGVWAVWNGVWAVWNGVWNGV